MKDYTKVYAIIFWISLLSILVWVVLKILGYINTPPLVEWYPVLGAIFCAGAFFKQLMGEYETESKTFWEKILRGEKMLGDKEAEEFRAVTRRARKEYGFRT